MLDSFSRLEGVSAGGAESWGLQAELEDKVGARPRSPVSCPNPGGLCRVGLGEVEDLHKTSPLVIQPPIVASVTLG